MPRKLRTHKNQQPVKNQKVSLIILSEEIFQFLRQIKLPQISVNSSQKKSFSFFIIFQHNVFYNSAFWIGHSYLVRIIFKYFNNLKLFDCCQYDFHMTQNLCFFASFSIMYVIDKSDRYSSMPCTVLRLRVDKGQGLWSGILVSFNRVLPVQ